MKVKIIAGLVVTGTLFFSCQKEITGDVKSGGNGGTGGSSNGDLLIKGLGITTGTNDTTVSTFGYDANKRLIAYNSTGKANGTNIDLHYTITRLSDGKISRIVFKSAMQPGLDSGVYYPHYISGTSKLSYVIDTQFTSFGNLRDSVAYIYNSSNQITSKETFGTVFGISIPPTKATYAYDASGNLILMTIYASLGGGGYTQTGINNYTYNTHKSAGTFGEESFIFLGEAYVSKNDGTQGTINTGGTIYTTTASQKQYNSFDRPTQAVTSLTPKPPGYDGKVFYYYQ